MGVGPWMIYLLCIRSLPICFCFVGLGANVDFPFLHGLALVVHRLAAICRFRLGIPLSPETIVRIIKAEPM